MEEEELDARRVAEITANELKKMRKHLTPESAYELVLKSLDAQIEQLESRGSPMLRLAVESPMYW
jgi:hypothetical protein